MAPKRIIFPVVATGFLLSGCVTGDTNPATAGLFDNINNLRSGEYDRQIRAKDAEAAAITAANNRSQSNVAALRSERASNAALISSLRAEIAGVRQEISRVRARVRSDPSKVSRLSQFERQLGGVEADVNRGNVSQATSRELSTIRSSVRALAAS